MTNHIGSNHHRAVHYDPLGIALSIAAGGLPVFPCTNTKKPAIAKRDGGRGFLDATTDPERIRDLFSHAGASLVGVPTGPVSGFDVLDLDDRHGATEWEEANRYRLPRTRTHRTLSGGKHLLFRDALGVRNLASKFAPGIGVRGEGGYLVHPPSAGYSVIDNAPVAEWPEWLLSLVLRPPPAPRPIPSSAPLPHDSPRIGAYVEAVLARVRAAPDGAKHYRLRNAALILGGLQPQLRYSDTQITELLIDALPRSVRDWHAARKTIAWGVEHGRERPLRLEERRHFNNSVARPIEPPKWSAEGRGDFGNVLASGGTRSPSPRGGCR
jgi:hypothetical protein